MARCFYSSRYDRFDLLHCFKVRNDIDLLDLEREAVAAFINWSGSFEVDSFHDSFMGKYASEEDFAVQLVEDCGMLAGVPEHVTRYFDMQAFARDLFMGDYYMDDRLCVRQYLTKDDEQRPGEIPAYLLVRRSRKICG